MAMYYQSSSEIEAVNINPIHTLYLMNPNYIHTHPQQAMCEIGNNQQHAGFHKPADHDFPAPINSTDTWMIMGSKYLKAAQELLDELVNVGKSHRTQKPKPIKPAAAADLTPTQRQEIQMKKAKLNTMLDEVEQRCRQYNQQMQLIVAAFEQVAGPGSARSYTQLALKTILKQFRCLKSTISSQVKALSKSLGEGSEMSRLHNNAWRPQRGLPERAVSVLRAWLFQHFLHPYPKDSDKQMLAKQTGLTRSQVSNWFINARVRLWKPMVEEMYLQEEETNNNNAAPIIKPEPTTAVEEVSPEKNPKKRSIDHALPPPHTFLSHRPFDFQPSPMVELDAAPRIAPYNQIIDFHNDRKLLPDFVA